MLTKVFTLCVLVSLVYGGNRANCCDLKFPNAGNDISWFVYAPPDVSIQCHLDLLGGSYAANVDPNYTGWAWEVDGCLLSEVTICLAGSSDWCSDGNPTPGGINAPVTGYTDNFVAGCGITRTYTRTWSSVSLCPANPLTIAQTISLVDTIAPTLAIPSDLEFECPPSPPNTASVAEMDNLFGSPDVIDFCRSFTDNDISQSASAIDATTGTFTRSFFISDGCQDSSGQQTITLSDTTPPVLQRIRNVHQECGIAIPFTPPAAQDTCYRTNDAAIVVSAADVTYEGTCAGKFSIVRTWTATDPSGNSVSETQVIVVDDTTPPTIAPVPAAAVNIMNVDCFSDINFPYTQVDTCGGVADRVVPYDISLSHNEDEGRTEVLVTYASSDLCGNGQQWADLWQVNSGVGVFTDTISGPTSLVDKGTTFTITIDVTQANDCIPFGILVVDAGYANLVSASSSTCFFQAATGVIYCDPVPTVVPFTLTLDLVVPADYLGDDLLISISWHYNYRTTAVIIGSYLVSFNP